MTRRPYNIRALIFLARTRCFGAALAPPHLSLLPYSAAVGGSKAPKTASFAQVLKTVVALAQPNTSRCPTSPRSPRREREHSRPPPPPFQKRRGRLVFQAASCRGSPQSTTDSNTPSGFGPFPNRAESNRFNTAGFRPRRSPPGCAPRT